MEEKERAHRDAYFQREMDFLKLNMAHITSLLEQTLKNISGEGPSNWPITFAQPEEGIMAKVRNPTAIWYLCSRLYPHQPQKLWMYMLLSPTR